MVVEDHFDIQGRGVVVTVRVVRGPKPPVGTTVIVTAEDRPAVQGLISGRPMLHRRPEAQDCFLLRGLTAQDVPVGAHVTTMSTSE
jgi:translation elongation factor EF-Tu-like GTPase